MAKLIDELKSRAKGVASLAGASEAKRRSKRVTRRVVDDLADRFASRASSAGREAVAAEKAKQRKRIGKILKSGNQDEINKLIKNARKFRKK